MDYFAVGGRPLLSRFPPHLFGQRHSYDQVFAEAASAQAAQRAEEGADASSSYGGAVAPLPPLVRLGRHTGAVVAAPDVSDVSPRNLPQVLVSPLHSFYDAKKQAKQWQPGDFELIRKLQDATRNRGYVFLMRDVSEDRLVAVKQMPSRWVRGSHTEFVAEHPSETELPWQDVGCVQFLNNEGYLYGCRLLGVYHDEQHTYVVTSFATEGDLFTWCEAGVAPGLEREDVVLPIARQLMKGVQQLHDHGIVHRDLSLENVLLTKLGEGPAGLRVQIIDFSMASTTRCFRNCIRGKASYQAPEFHGDKDYDGLLSDVFSIGVTLYALLLKDYPWLSTRPGGCKCFEYVKKHGFRAYLLKRKLRNSGSRVADVLSEPLTQLLEGLLALDPAERFTLGESAWASSGRRSVWDEPWMAGDPQ